jgi:putative copper export protein
MLSGEQKIRRGFHWVAVMLAALLLAFGLVLITFDVRDLWHTSEEDIPPTSIGDLLLGVLGLVIASVAVWAAVRALGWIVVRLYRRYENQKQPD